MTLGIRARLAAWPSRTFMHWNGADYEYEWLLERTVYWEQRLSMEGVAPGTVVALEADYSPETTALLLALWCGRHIAVPLLRSLPEAERGMLSRLAGAEALIRVDDADRVAIESTDRSEEVERHDMIRNLGDAGVPGLVLFSSGSTGTRKAVLHDAERFANAVEAMRKPYRVIPFMLFDHVGGLNTLLAALAGGACLVPVYDRSPAAVCRVIELGRVQALPATPTFLRLLLLSGAWRSSDLSSLEVLAYGAEPMPPETLSRLREVFPGLRLAQNYGLSEAGIVKVRTVDADSPRVRLETGEARIVDGELQLRLPGAMLGYLNAPSPFTDDGWLRTGDMAVQEDGSIRILGRCSEVINVGGEKVLPSEVEAVLLELEGIEEAVVGGEPHPLLGQIVKAVVKPVNPKQDDAELRKRIREHCRSRLPSYRIPQKIVVERDTLLGARLKKLRPAGMEQFGAIFK